MTPLRWVLAAGGVGGAAWVYNEATKDHKDGLARGLGLGRRYAAWSAWMNALDGESAHKLGVKVAALPQPARVWLGLVNTQPHDPILQTNVWGLRFDSPIGLAAGFDKDAHAMDGVLDMGFGFVEVGSITPQPQPGNARPRVFRLLEDRAIINRYGFNSEGVDAAAARLKARHETQSAAPTRGVVGVNLGKNKETVDAKSDYVIGVDKLGPYADYLVVNVSSPNTPGLRALQAGDQLTELLSHVKQARDRLPARGTATSRPQRPPLLVKVAPDLSPEEARQVAAACVRVGVDGLIVSNTTVDRPSFLQSSHRQEIGGLSGPPLFAKSTAMLRQMYSLTEGRIPIIGVGGVTSAEDAYAKIRQGASLVQLYTGFAFQGPGIATQINTDLARLLRRDKFKSLADAVGVDNPLPRAS